MTFPFVFPSNSTHRKPLFKFKSRQGQIDPETTLARKKKSEYPFAMDAIKPKVFFLYTNIGRGHPFYLDGIVEELVRSGQTRFVRGQTDVFEISRGLSGMAWRAARHLYKAGSSSEGAIGAFYRRLRAGSDYNRQTPSLRLMARDIRRHFAGSSDPVVVAHPVLVSILRNGPGLCYQHGEVVTPREAVVAGAEYIFVPTESAAQPFLEASYERGQVVTTGLCIEPPLVRQAADAFENRRERLRSSPFLSVAFFSSGAEPRPHVQKIAAAVESVSGAGHRAIVFARSHGRLAKSIMRRRRDAAACEIGVIDNRSPFPHELPPLTVARFANRRELDILTAQLFPHFDLFVAPSHERTNWALGLGLPLFILEPSIGPFAPLNRDYLVREPAVAEAIGDQYSAAQLASRIDSSHSREKLQKMAENGWNRFEINGFSRIADFLVTDLGRRA